jgi:deoxyadenosine/deoxycytidine kinase
VIQDRSIYEDATIFAYNLYKSKKINTRDYHTYLELYRTIVEFLPKPDLMIYVQASVPTLEARIRRRGRGYETNIDPDYLAQLNVLYERWTKNLTLCPVLILQGDKLDFRAGSEHISMVVEEIHTVLHGTRPEEPKKRINTHVRELVYAG